MNSKNIAYERTMMQLREIRAHVESVSNMLSETREGIVQDLDLIATELTYHEESGNESSI